MFFKLTDEQIMIQTMAREFSRKVVALTAAERDQTKEFPSENLKKMGELGLMGMMVPFEYEGSGADTVSYVLALSEIAYSCASTAVVMSVHNSIVCESLYRLGTEDQKKRYLKPLAAGDIIGAFAMTEPHAGSDPVRQSTTAVRKENEYIINGTKRFTTSGRNAGLVIVTAITDEAKRHHGISAFLVEKGTHKDKPISVRGIQKRMEHYARKTGLPISCHQLRRTMATPLLNADADLVTIQDL